MFAVTVTLEMTSPGFISRGKGKGKGKGKRTANGAELDWRVTHEETSDDEIEWRVRPVEEVDSGASAQATRHPNDRRRQGTYGCFIVFTVIIRMGWNGMEWNGIAMLSMYKPALLSSFDGSSSNINTTNRWE